MTNNRFTDNLNSDTNRLAKLRATMMADSAVPDPTDFGGMSASAVPSGGRADYVFTSQQVVLAHSRVLQTGHLDNSLRGGARTLGSPAPAHGPPSSLTAPSWLGFSCSPANTGRS